MAIQLSGTYVPTVPTATQQINNTQQPIETNFQDISELIGINHIPFNTANTFGKHNYIDYLSQSSAPGCSTGQMVMFAQTVNGVNQLAYQYPNISTVYPITGNPTIPSGNGAGGVIIFNGSQTEAGYQYLAGGIVMVFGLVTFTTPTYPTPYTGSQTFTFIQWGAQPQFTQSVFYMGILPWALSPSPGTGLVTATPINLTEFTISVQNSLGGSFRYMAIGI